MEQAFERASNIVYEWAKRKFIGVFPQMPYNKETLDYKRNGNEVGIIFDSEKGSFIFRCAHPDHYVAGRMWITDVVIKQDAEKYIFAMRLSVSSLQSCTEDIPFSRPEFVANIARHVGLSDILSIRGQKHILRTQEDVDLFIDLIEHSERRLPVILITPCYNALDAKCGDYMMDASHMADELLGVAHVFELSANVNEYLINILGKQWGAFNGAVRTYYPGFSLQDSNYYLHPLLTQNKIVLREMAETEDPNLCMHEVEEYVKNYTLRQHCSWEDSGVDFYLSAHQTYLKEQRATQFQLSEESCKINNALYEEEIDQLKRERDEWESYAVAYSKDVESLQSENEDQRRAIGRLKSQISALEQRFEVLGNELVVEIPQNCDYSDLENWIDCEMPNRVKLLPRASRSLKNAIYEDCELVFKCIKLLAFDYYNYRLGMCQYDEFMTACKNVDSGLDECGAITDVAAGMQGDEYYVQYRGKRRKLERHLTKGSSKDKRYCLRIYFFWDDEEQYVVIGDLPHHLDTTAT